MSVNTKRVSILTKKYRKNVIQPDGSVVLKNKTKKHLISKNFSHQSLVSDLYFFCSLPPYLVRTSIFPKGTYLDNDDAIFFRNWAFKTIQCFSINWITNKKIETYDNLKLLFSLLYCPNELTSIPVGSASFKVIKDAPFKLMSTFVYPFLESLLREELSKYLDRTGKINRKLPFKFTSMRRHKNYCSIGKRISNIGDELLLLKVTSKNKIATKNIHKTLKEFSKSLNNTQWDIYEFFAHQRNEVLHGEKMRKFSMVSMYIIFLIFISKISESDYKTKVKEIENHKVGFY